MRGRAAPVSSGLSLFQRIREASAEVARRARFVAIDDAALAVLCERLAVDGFEPPRLDPAHEPFADDEATLAYVVTVNAVNFGSGWFPVLAKRPGLSGYMTVATCLRERFEREGALAPGELRRFDVRDAAALFEQDPANGEAMQLMHHFERALCDLGTLLEQRHGGLFSSLVQAAGGRAERLVELLVAMPLYRDVAHYEGLEVPLYKRAQITASDLAMAFGGEGWGHFEDVDELTIFADNLVPHVLRCHGVLAYDDELAARIDAEQRLEPGSPEEVEIRAVALHAVERMVERLRAAGHGQANAHRLDQILWTSGQAPDIKARPRHRARSVYY